jgi:hypothetical protein
VADLSLAERTELADDLLAFTSVLLLDQVWSSAAVPDQLAPTEDDTLREVVERLHAAVNESVKRSSRMSQIIERHHQPLDKQLGRVMERIERDDRRSVENLLVSHNGSIAQMARRSSDLLAAEAPASQAEIDAQFRTLLGGAGAPGDLSPSFLCAMAKCMMAGGLVATWIPPHVQGPAVVGAAVTVYKTVGCQG